MGWLRAGRCAGQADRLHRPVDLTPSAHFSHELELAGEVIICKKCGYYTGVATCVRDLRWPCSRRLAPRAGENFRRTGLGRHPRSGKPMEDMAEQDILELE